MKGYMMKIIPKQVFILRNELEKANFKPGKERLNRMIEMHKRFMPNESYLNKSVYYDGRMIANCFRKIVIGGHGPYIELGESYFSCDLEITKGQEWRCGSKYKKVKYLLMNPVGLPDLKVYYQMKKVSYADYIPGLYYIDYWSVDFVDRILK